VLCAAAQAANRAAELVTGRRPFSDGSGPLHHHLGVSAFAERTVVSPRSLIPVPEDVPLAVAAVFGCAVLTGVGAVLNTAGVRPGDSVAIFGLGGVGLAAAMGAVLVGASPIVVVDRVPDKLDLATELGADHGVVADGSEVEAVRELTGGGAQWTFEAAGSVPVLQACYAAARPGGTAVSVGLPHPDHDFAIKAVTLVAEEKTVRGSYMGSSVPRRDLPKLLELYRRGRLPVERLVTTRGLALGDLNQALDLLSEGREVRQIVEPHAG
ncbi:MAG: zinc-binding dehydrogenase, partial [Acidimicrobiia bacterium]